MVLPILKRRSLLQAGALAIAPGAFAQPGGVVAKPIPSSGERIPVVGLGTWITFNVGRDAAARAECAEVVRSFLDAGGRMIDSSPMYGESERVLGPITPLGGVAVLAGWAFLAVEGLRRPVSA